MASLRRLPNSPNFIACFTGVDGKRYQRSTGVRADGTVKARRTAQRIADEFEELVRRKKAAAQVQRVIHDLVKEATGETLPSTSIRPLAESWLRQRRAEVSDSTYRAYEVKLGTFVAKLREKADRPIPEITKQDILDFRESEALRVSATTVNTSLKVLRQFFRSAQSEGFIADNPAEGIPPLKKQRRTQRRPFTIAEVRSLLLIADAEWKNMILFGFYTGQRLGDIASLVWGQIDLENLELRLTTRKTNRHQKIPIPLPLGSHLGTLPRGQFSDSIHPYASSIIERQGRVAALSIQFHNLMACAGIVSKRPHSRVSSGERSDNKRRESELSFHSLRHTTTSVLKNAGISSAIAEEFVGHESAEMNRVYTHIELQAMRKAAEALPNLLEPVCSDAS